MAGAGHQLRAVGNFQRRFFLCRGTKSDQLVAETRELRMFRVKRRQIRAFVRYGRQRVDDRPAGDKLGHAVEIRAELGRRIGNPVTTGVAGIFHRGQRQASLSDGQVVRAVVARGRGLQFGNFVVGGTQSPAIGVLEGRDKVLGGIVVAGLVHPQRRAHARAIELYQHLTVCVVGARERFFGVVLQVACDRKIEEIIDGNDRRGRRRRSRRS